MNPIPAFSQDEPNVVEFSESPGRRLRVQRQSRGIEVERIAAQLHLRVAAIEALEQDRYEDLPGPVFVAGYLRNYARLLGLDAEPLIDAFRAAHPNPAPDGLQVGPLPRQEIGSSHILVRLISLALLAAVVAMLALWWQNRAEVLSSLTPGESSASALTTPAPGTPPERAPGLPDRTAQAPEPGALPLPTATAPRPEPAPEQPARPVQPSSDTAAPGATAANPDPTKVSAPAEPVPSAPTNPHEVIITFSAPTWIRVRDSAGTAVLTGDVRKGDTRVLGGSPPYSFAVGSTSALAITVGGRPVKPASRVQGRVARFTIDPRTPE